MSLPLIITPGDPGHIDDHEEIHALLDDVVTPFTVMPVAQGTLAARPAAGTARRLYLATDVPALYYDNGTNWLQQLSAATANTFSAPQTYDDDAYFGSGRPWVDVRWAGAAGDGVTIDTTDVQSALTAGGGLAVFVSAGNYKLGAQVTIPDDTLVFGSGAGSVISTALTTTTNLVVVGSHCTVRDVAFNATTDHTNVLVALYTNSETDIGIEGCRFTGRWTQAINTYFGGDVRIHGCHFEGVGLLTGSAPGDGVNVYGSIDVTITGNTFRDMKQDAVYFNFGAANCTFQGNTVYGGPEGVQVRQNCSHITISGNGFSIKGLAGINSFGVIIQTDSTDCSVTGNTFRTTAGTAAPGWAVNVDTRCHRTTVANNNVSGLYNKGVAVLTTGIAGTESTDCDVSNNRVYNLTSYAIHVGASENRATINGNKVRQGGATGIQCVASYCTIGNNHVTGVASWGIAVSGSYCAIKGNISSDNTSGGSGIYVTGTHCTVSGNICTGNAAFGILEGAGGDYNAIGDNVVTGNGDATWDIPAAVGASTKISYNIGRYTQKGAA